MDGEMAEPASQLFRQIDRKTDMHGYARICADRAHTHVYYFMLNVMLW